MCLEALKRVNSYYMSTVNVLAKWHFVLREIALVSYKHQLERRQITYCNITNHWKMLEQKKDACLQQKDDIFDVKLHKNSEKQRNQNWSMEMAKLQIEWWRKHILIVIVVIIIIIIIFLLLVVVGPMGIRPLKLDVAAESFRTITVIAFLDLGMPQD